MDKRSKKYENIYNRELAKIEKKIEKIFSRSIPKSLYEPSEYIMRSGGKRLRPFLVLLSAKAVGGKFSDAYNAALAVEILHNFTLVHDDIMDNANKRRGRDTLHIKYDLSTAILTGDSLTAYAYKFLLKDCKENTKEILSTFTDGVIEICEGQSYDKDFETMKKVTIDNYLLMIQKKTAALVEMCCSIGAQIGGGTKAEIRNLERYGRNLGLAFQLQDDLLDIMGDETKFGKKLGGDLMEGKKTYLFLKALEKAKGEDKKMLIKVIENKGIRKNQVNKYKLLYENLGVFEDTKNLINLYTQKALNAAKKVRDPLAGEILIWLANALMVRSR